MSNHDENSGSNKAVIILLAVCGVVVVGGGLAVVLCCGGGMWFASQAVNVTQNPTEIDDRLANLISIDVPEGFEPRMAMRMNLGFAMEMMMYSPDLNADQGRALMVMQMQMQGASQAEMQQQMKMQSNQQGMGNEDINIESSEIRTFTIDGEECDFMFAVGKDDYGRTIHQVTGVIPGKQWPVMLMLMEDEDHWDEDVAVRMIESISVP